jgi:hypothetical protein
LSSPDNPRLEPQIGPHPPVSGDVSAEDTASSHGAPDLFSSDSLSSDPYSSAHPPAPVETYPTVSAIPPPVENPVWSGWDVLLIAALTFVTMVVLQLGVMFGAHWLWYPRESLSDVAQKPILLMASQFLLYIAVAACMVAVVEGKYHVAFWPAIRWNWPSAGWRLLTLGAAMFFGLVLLQNFLPTPKDTPFEHLFDRPRDAYLLSIIAVSFGPLMEELFFRGFLYPVLERRTGVAWAVMLTALPFGLIHLPQYAWAWSAALVVFLVGVVCGVVRAATKSVGASFLVHVGYNGMQMVIAVVATHGFQHMEKGLAIGPR